MTIDVLTPDRIAMSQKERDVLKILHGVLHGEPLEVNGDPHPPCRRGSKVAVQSLHVSFPLHHLRPPHAAWRPRLRA